MKYDETQKMKYDSRKCPLIRFMLRHCFEKQHCNVTFFREKRLRDENVILRCWKIEQGYYIEMGRSYFNESNLEYWWCEHNETKV